MKVLNPQMLTYGPGMSWRGCTLPSPVRFKQPSRALERVMVVQKERCSELREVRDA